MTPGLLSVILPNYNHSALITDQISAILSQSYRNFEFIIIDDASTDQSIAVIESAIRGDPRAMLVRNERNLGINANMDKGRLMARGEFLFFASADDRVFPGYFEKSISALQQVPQAGICCPDPYIFDGQTLQLRLLYPPYWADRPTYFTPDALCDLICGQTLPTYAAIYRRAAWDQAQPPLEKYRCLEWHGDWFVGHVIACRTGVCYIPELLAALRVAPECYSQKMYQWEYQKDVLLAILELLHTEAYRDVVPYFARGALLSMHDYDSMLVRLVMSRPDMWDPVTMMLVQKSLIDWTLRMHQTRNNRLQRAQQEMQQQQAAGRR